VLTAVFGIALLFINNWIGNLATGWLATKLLLVGLLIAYHLYCGRIMREFRTGTARHSHVYYRWINEIPALLLVAIVLLAVVKPF
ncbi:MAG: CopD family protein, partial [Gammaproteobacteria bacterium]